MISEALDFKYLLLDNYKNLNIKEDELCVIFLIDHLISQGNKLITPDLLALKMSLDVKKIDTILATLITRGFLEYQTSSKKASCSLNPLKEKLIKDFEKSISKEQTSERNIDLKKHEDECLKNIEELFKRSLSPIEISTVKDWIINGYHCEDILDAAKDSISKGKKTIRNIEKILVSWRQRNDIETDGITSISRDWNKSLEETIKIAKTPWLDQDENDEK